jgi:hypothetical protein
MSDVNQFLVPALGALVQEVIYLYDRRDQLASPQYVGMLKSPWYWGITLLMVLVSGAGTYALYGQTIREGSALFFIGAAFPYLFKNSVARVVKNATPQGSAGAPGGPPGWPGGIGPALNLGVRKFDLGETVAAYLR